jgi:hypothetical protein
VEIIPEHDRSHGPSALQVLSEIPGWNESWTTLVIYKEKGRICSKTDISYPHTVPKESLLPDYPIVDVSSLNAITRPSFRTSEVSYNDKESYLKIARFPFELKWISQEIKAYHALRKSSLVPGLLGYACESQDHNRVIGFLVEKVNGHHAELEDLQACIEALEKLHGFLIHGDICKYNIIVSSEGPKFIDLEDSVLVDAEKWSIELKDKERQSIARKLADDSGAGRPW